MLRLRGGQGTLWASAGLPVHSYCPVSEVRRQKRVMLARIWSAVLTHTKGLGFSLLRLT